MGKWGLSLAMKVVRIFTVVIIWSNVFMYAIRNEMLSKLVEYRMYDTDCVNMIIQNIVYAAFLSGEQQIGLKPEVTTGRVFLVTVSCAV